MGVGNGEERSPAAGYTVIGQPGGNRVAMASVRPAVAVRPEHVESTALLSLFSSLAAGVGRRPGRFQRSDRIGKGVRSLLPLRRLDLVIQGIRDAVLFL
ncbi:MAG: hypothetical protein F4X66_09085 [Chloroflexi bacterium]|nr:hypothetical protein [Chloroflexota bacterium]MYE39180.1 hypothetical protein [Chloroflexota bacterium]